MVMPNLSKLPVYKVETLPPLVRKDALRKRIIIGPIKLPGVKVDATGKPITSMSSMLGMDPEMAASFHEGAAAVPCNDCTLLFTRGDLQFANGTQANVANGVYIHHIVLFNNAPHHGLLGCDFEKFPKMPGPDGDFAPPDPFVGFGNERSTASWTNHDATFKSGYYLDPSYSYTFYTELMNMDQADKEVYPVLDYEYLPGKQPDFMDTRALLLNTNVCTPEGAKPVNDKAFSVTSEPYLSQFDGSIVDIVGHMHDGGSSIEVALNGKHICTASAVYGATPQSIERSTRKYGLTGAKHITYVEDCTDVIPVKKNDSIVVTSHYDFSKNRGMKNFKGKPEGIMGIAQVYLASHDYPK
jgi:hypothetical protein